MFEALDMGRSIVSGEAAAGVTAPRRPFRLCRYAADISLAPRKVGLSISDIGFIASLKEGVNSAQWKKATKVGFFCMIRFETIPDEARPRVRKAKRPPRAKREDRPPIQIEGPSQEPEGASRTLLTVAQIKAARALLGWKQEDLAIASGVSLAGLTNIERGTADPRAKTLAKIQDALERAGLEIIHKGDGKGEGLRFAKAKGDRPEAVDPQAVREVSE
jgi:transcriptional regulator with XRE-family HTH domain